jgi:hypothetical protein
MRKLRSITLVVTCCISCGSTDAAPTSTNLSNGGSPTSGSEDLEPTRADNPQAPLVGNFTVSIPPPDPKTGALAPAAFQGVVRDGPAAETTTWSVIDEDDHCTLSQPSIPFCEPTCASGSACVTGDVCQPYPSALNLGQATISGLELDDGAQQFTLTPLRPNFNYLPGASVTLVNPPVAEGEPVQLVTAGGDFEPVTLVALGVAPLDFHTDGEALPFEPDAPLLLEWAAAAKPERSTIFIEVDISHHGGAKGKINCTAPDVGRLEIAQPLVSGLIDLGVAGFPTIRVGRRSAGFASIEPGQLALEIVSDLELPLAIPGLISCTGPDDCETSQTCGADRTCQ